MVITSVSIAVRQILDSCPGEMVNLVEVDAKVGTSTCSIRPKEEAIELLCVKIISEYDFCKVN